MSMAWNPSPEVAIVRDAARRLDEITKGHVNRAVLLYTTRTDGLGYVSYGVNREQCGLAKRLAEVAFESVREGFPNLVEYHYRHDWKQLSAGEEIDWEGIRRDVLLRLEILEKMLDADNVDEHARRLLVRDLVLPAVELIGRFCSCVQEGEPA